MHPGRLVGGVRASDTEHRRHGALAAEELYRALAVFPGEGAAQRAGMDLAVGINALDNHADLVFVRVYLDCPFARAPGNAADQVAGHVVVHFGTPLAEVGQEQGVHLPFLARG